MKHVTYSEIGRALAKNRWGRNYASVEAAIPELSSSDLTMCVLAHIARMIDDDMSAKANRLVAAQLLKYKADFAKLTPRSNDRDYGDPAETIQRFAVSVDNVRARRAILRFSDIRDITEENLKCTRNCGNSTIQVIMPALREFLQTLPGVKPTESINTSLVALGYSIQPGVWESP